MVRPTKPRRVEFIPSLQVFGPYDVDISELEENVLHIEELEAVRLKDLEELDNELCANRMEVSRQTFQRILGTARAKIADSLINGKTIRIEGGNYTRNICLVQCLDCGSTWKETYENFEKILKGDCLCPECGSKRIVCGGREKKMFCRKNCWRYRGNRGNR